MNFKLSKKELLNSLQKINRVIPTRSTLPILSCVLFEIKKNKLSLRATDLEQTILINIDINSAEESKLAIPVKTLLEITQEIPDENLNIIINTIIRSKFKQILVTIALWENLQMNFQKFQMLKTP